MYKYELKYLDCLVGVHCTSLIYVKTDAFILNSQFKRKNSTETARENPHEIFDKLCYYHFLIWWVCFKHIFNPGIYIHMWNNITLVIISHVHHIHSLFAKTIFHEYFILTILTIFEPLMLGFVPSLYYRTIYPFKAYIILFKYI